MSVSHEKIIESLRNKLEILKLQLEIEKLQTERFSLHKILPKEMTSDFIVSEIENKERLNEMQSTFTPAYGSNSSKPFDSSKSNILDTPKSKTNDAKK